MQISSLAQVENVLFVRVNVKYTLAHMVIINSQKHAC